jgi:hypothetical protein
MRVTLKNAAVVLVLGVTLTGGPMANAARVTFDIGNVAVGYSDGYYDNAHSWHPWAHAADARHYRAAHKDMYHTWRHDDPKHPDDGRH